MVLRLRFRTPSHDVNEVLFLVVKQQERHRVARNHVGPFLTT